MKLNRYLQVFILGLSYCMMACSTPSTPKQQSALPEGAMGGTVVNAMQASQYVIMELKNGEDTIWAAATFTELKPGDLVQLMGPMRMTDFTVKSLDRTFSEIYFASGLLVNGEESDLAESASMDSSVGSSMPEGHPEIPAMQSPHGEMSKSPQAAISAEEVLPLEGSVSIQQLLENPASFSGKTVRMKGVATKFLQGIMKRNWIHVQDNTCGENHLTVTTQQTVTPGRVIVFEGVVKTDVDFGHGYSYAILVEDARILAEPSTP